MGTPTDYYVDPSIAGNSGSGTIGDPYGDLQHALDSVTRDSTNGDQFNIKAGTDEILSAALDLSTYGTPSKSARVFFRGYTTSKGDGGIGGISGGGSVAILAATVQYITWRDMHLHNCGSADIVQASDGTAFENVEINNTTGDGIAGVFGDDHSIVAGCNIHDIAGSGLIIPGGGAVGWKCIGNYFKNDGSNDFTKAVEVESDAIVSGCFFSLDGASIGVSVETAGCLVDGNSFLANAGTGAGISASGSGSDWLSILNNLFEGFSGTGGAGVKLSSSNEILTIGHNKFFNNTNNISSEPGDNWKALDLGNTESLGSTPYDKSGSDTFPNRYPYFAPADVGNVLGGAYVGG